MKFYSVNLDYVEYIKQYDSKVPNIECGEDRNSKFVCGVVLIVDDINYFVPVSSYKIKERTNIQIFDNDTALGTLRFSFMFPCPLECVRQMDISSVQDYRYKRLLLKEYAFVKGNIDVIEEKAKEVYKMGCNINHYLNKYCCDFPLLEKACVKFVESSKKKLVKKTAIIKKDNGMER